MSSSEIISTYLIPAVVTLLTGLAGYIGMKLKVLYEKRCNDRTKRTVVRTAVKAVEQLYHGLGMKRKLEEATKGAFEMLAEKGIDISELELRMMIESVIAEFNYSFGGLSVENAEVEQ